ncbi:MAG: pitrilysin family protein [Deltaproteobacteria bacterium]
MSCATWLAARWRRTRVWLRLCQQPANRAGGGAGIGLALALSVTSLGLDASAAGAGREQRGGNDTSPAADTRPPELSRLAIRRARLDNGLRVVLNRDTSLPTVAICVSYAVGVRNEGPDQRGFAPLLERLMFQGSRNVAADEHARWIREHGGQHSAQTSSDRTQFVDLLPSPALALGLWLEADRMKSLELSLAASERQRGILRAEAAPQNQDPQALGERELRALVFRDVPAYARDPLDVARGLGADPQAAPGAAPGTPGQLQLLREFHRQFYAANNAVLTVAGNFEVLEALNLIQIYFADARSASLPPAPGGAPREQDEPRSATLEGEHAAGSSLWQGWAIPAKRTPDHDALELTAVILGTGVTSRLYQALVADKALVRAVTVWTDDHRGPDLFGVQATLLEGTDPELVSRLILGQIASLGRFGPTSLELSRAQNQLRSRLLAGLDGNRARAITLADAELFTHDARLLDTDFEQYRQISREDVQRAVARYLRNAGRNSVLVRPRSP